MKLLDVDIRIRSPLHIIICMRRVHVSSWGISRRRHCVRVIHCAALFHLMHLLMGLCGMSNMLRNHVPAHKARDQHKNNRNQVLFVLHMY